MNEIENQSKGQNLIHNRISLYENQSDIIINNKQIAPLDTPLLSSYNSK